MNWIGVNQRKIFHCDGELRYQNPLPLTPCFRLFPFRRADPSMELHVLRRITVQLANHLHMNPEELGDFIGSMLPPRTVQNQLPERGMLNIESGFMDRYNEGGTYTGTSPPRDTGHLSLPSSQDYSSHSMYPHPMYAPSVQRQAYDRHVNIQSAPALSTFCPLALPNTPQGVDLVGNNSSNRYLSDEGATYVDFDTVGLDSRSH